MSTRVTAIKHKVDNENGATAVEYAIMVAFIASVVLSGVALLGIKVETVFHPVINGLK